MTTNDHSAKHPYSCLQDECYQVRQIFAQKLHLALVKLLLPLEYLAVFALCAKDPVKERRAHARQCLLKNISVRREYIKQNPLAQGQCLIGNLLHVTTDFYLFIFYCFWTEVFQFGVF